MTNKLHLRHRIARAHTTKTHIVSVSRVLLSSAEPRWLWINVVFFFCFVVFHFHHHKKPEKWAQAVYRLIVVENFIEKLVYIRPRSVQHSQCLYSKVENLKKYLKKKTTAEVVLFINFNGGNRFPQLSQKWRINEHMNINMCVYVWTKPK
jgi:hypothetical protein